MLVESSGAPEASAAAAELAIERGMHVVMVSKETDSVVGSILARKAAERGLVYTTGDGDQPSLLIGLISWGRVLGMNIVGAGKSSEYDFIYDPARDMVLCPGQKQEIATPGMGSLWQFGNRPAEEVVGKRRAMLTSLSHRSVPDLCEMAVVANATGMMPDRPLFHAPVARIDEMPDLFCPKADGGLFDAPGRLDIFNCFRRPDEASMAGASSSSWNARTKIVAGAQGQGAPVQPQRPLRRAVPSRPPARRGNGHQRPRGGPHEARHRRRQPAPAVRPVRARRARPSQGDRP